MQRAPLVLAATVAGLAATLGFHASAPPATVTTGSTTQSGTAGSSSSSPSKTASSSASKTVTSDEVQTQYGPLQLKVTIKSGKIAAIETLELPSNDPKSQQIGAYAEPLLQQSALTKQDGTVDVVSGATYTSDGYQSALQSALDQAGVQLSSSSSGTAS